MAGTSNPTPPVQHVFDNIGLLDTILPSIDSAVAVTKNAAAILSVSGEYGQPSHLGDPWYADSGIMVRFAEDSVGSFVVDEPRQVGPAQIIRVMGPNQSQLHGAYLTSPAQIQVGGLSRPGSMRARDDYDEWANSPSSKADATVLTECSTLGHLDSIVRDGGLRRRLALDHLPHQLGDPVHVGIGFHALEHLWTLRTPLSLIVPTPGCLHWHNAPIDALRDHGGKLALGAGDGSLTIDRDLIADAWIIRPTSGPPLLEFYDDEGNAVLVITQMFERDPVDAIRWEHISAMISIS